MRKLLLVLVVLWSASFGVNAQELWGKATFGMTPSQVKEVYPQATPARGTVGLSDRLLQMNFIALGEFQTTVHFLFREQRLYGVEWIFKPDKPFEATKATYETLLDGMKQEHPKDNFIAHHRPFELSASDRAKTATWYVERLDRQARSMSDEWSTNGGTKVSMRMEEVVRGEAAHVNISTSNEQSWRRLQAEAEDARQEQRLAKIRDDKRADERRHSDFFDSFVGKNINALAASAGAPNATTAMPKGEVIYVWEIRPGEGLSCRTSVFTKKNGLIYNWQWSGNSCRRKQ